MASLAFGPADYLGPYTETGVAGTEAGDVGSTYDFAINISYVSSNGITTTQYGLKNVIGKYS